MELNAKKKYKLIELETPTDTEEIEEYENTYLTIIKAIIKATFKALKFSLYLVISFLELLIKLLKVLFNMNEYKPLQGVTDGKNTILNRIAQKEINKEKIRFTFDYMGRHEFIFPRSDLFLSCYKEIQQRLKDISEHNINLNNELYKDTIKEINCLIVEVEKQSLKLGYEYARETKYKLDTSTVYDEFITSKIMTGESNRKFRSEE